MQVLFGIHYAVAKELLHWIEPAAWVTLRIVVAAFVLQVFVFRRGGGLPRSAREWIHVAGLALCGVVVNQICFIEGLSRTIPAHSALIMTTIPLWTVAFASLLRRERLTLRRTTAIGCGLVGVWTLLRADRFHLELDLLAGDLLTLVWVLAAYAIFGATVIAHGLNLWALRRTASTLIALFVYLQPVVATAVDGLLLGRWPSWRFAVAAVLVLGLLASLVLAVHKAPGYVRLLFG